uniref:F-box domain-containing protein n=1 Tax=Mycena chlorophos TaxID=658473 RepID=A0ABQ0M9Z0_MYCCL|nr:predicted protein [Mycena chlorophos]
MSFQTLPTELVALIANEVGHGESISLGLPASGQSKIIVFSQVCASWRAIAFSLRPLWAHYTLDLRADKSTRRQHQWVRERFDECIARAGKHPVHLEVVQEDPEYGLSLLMRLLSAHSSSLGSLSLDIPDKTFVTLAKHTCFRFDTLRSLRITLHLNEKHEQTLLPDDRPSRFFAKMPHLENLELGYHEWCPLAEIIPQLDEWALPLGRLRSFSMQHLWLELPELLQIVDGASELTECRAYVEAPPLRERPIEEEFVPLQLPHLRKLALVFRVPHPTIWRQFVAPELDMLDITMFTEPDEEDEHWQCPLPENSERFYSEQPKARRVVYRDFPMDCMCTI